MSLRCVTLTRDLDRLHLNCSEEIQSWALAAVCLKAASYPQTGATAAAHNVPRSHFNNNTTCPWTEHVLKQCYKHIFKRGSDFLHTE